MRTSIGGLLVLVWIASALIACSTGDNVSLVRRTSTEQGSVAVLTDAQVHLYQSGLKQIIAKPETASFKGVTAMTFAQKPGLHICGYVRSEVAPGKIVAQRFYVELRADEGGENFSVHRGQIGADEAKLAKVKFVCSGHETAM